MGFIKSTYCWFLTFLYPYYHFLGHLGIDCVCSTDHIHPAVQHREIKEIIDWKMQITEDKMYFFPYIANINLYNVNVPYCYIYNIGI